MALLKYYKTITDQCLDQLTENEIRYRPDDSQNSILIIIQHLIGNMRSRWTNFLTEDGEKPWRHRDKEFEDSGIPVKDLMQDWQNVWALVFGELAKIEDSDLENLVYIRNMGHTIREAIHRQMTHCAYHTGQIVLLGKMYKGRDWQALTIPRGKSESFNAAHFTNERSRKHFTDEFLQDD